MKYYIAYKFSGADKQNLKEILIEVSKIVESQGNKTFISYRDLNDWNQIKMTSKEIITRALAELRESDCVLCLVFSSQKSEGMLLEVGFAKALGKKIIVAQQKDAKIVFLKDMADELIEFNNYEDLKNKLQEYFKK